MDGIRTIMAGGVHADIGMDIGTVSTTATTMGICAGMPQDGMPEVWLAIGMEADTLPIAAIFIETDQTGSNILVPGLQAGQRPGQVQDHQPNLYDHQLAIGPPPAKTIYIPTEVGMCINETKTAIGNSETMGNGIIREPDKVRIT